VNIYVNPITGTLAVVSVTYSVCRPWNESINSRYCAIKRQHHQPETAQGTDQPTPQYHQIHPIPLTLCSSRKRRELQGREDAYHPAKSVHMNPLEVVSVSTWIVDSWESSASDSPVDRPGKRITVPPHLGG
jgi:hypothetical protein